jgi:hypothetical protein
MSMSGYRKSESGDGMASGEDVTLWNDRGEPVREFRGSLHTDDND